MTKIQGSPPARQLSVPGRSQLDDAVDLQASQPVLGSPKAGLQQYWLELDAVKFQAVLQSAASTASLKGFPSRDQVGP